MRFEALGPLGVIADQGPVQLRPAHRRLLASLLLTHDAPVPTDTLIERMWGESAPATAHNTLHVHLSGLRRHVPGLIQAAGDGYALMVNGHGFDVREFSRLAERASRRLGEGRFREAGDAADRASKLWRGDPFPELVDVDAARAERYRLSELLILARTTRARALTLQGRVSESIAVLRQVVVDHPFNEALWEELILAYYLAGRQADALAAFQEARRTLVEQLGVDPGPRLQELEDRILLQDPVLIQNRQNHVPNNLVSPTNSFIGREHDLDRVAELLEDHRMVTITGAPGVGKTRLALESAHALLDRYSGGVWWIRLVGATSASDLLATVAAVAGANTGGSLEDLGAALGSRPCLFVLDNCEHLVEEVAVLAGSCLSVSGPVRLLLTSRNPIGVNGEVMWRLAPLPVPGGEDVRTPLDNPTVRLFVDRVLDLDPSFELNAATIRDLIELCRRTAGIPLALELAAGWVPALSLQDVVEVANRPPPNTVRSDTPHHGSLGTAVDWSLGLLNPEDRQTLFAATVFASDFDLAAFHTVCLPRANVTRTAQAISSLVSASLVVADRSSSGSLRYRILEPIREYCQEYVDDPLDLRDRHAAWFIERSGVHDSLAGGPDEASSFQIIDFEIADFRSALRHLIDGGRHNDAARIATMLSEYWFARYLGWEATNWLDEILSGDLEPALRVGALCAAGWAAYTRAAYPVARARYTEARDLAEEIGDRKGEGDAWYGLARVETGTNPDGWKPILEKAIEVFESVEDTEVELIRCYAWVALDACNRGERARAEPLYARVIEVAERHSMSRSVSMAHTYLSVAAMLDEDEQGATEHITKAEAIARQAEEMPALYAALHQRALVESRWGSVDRAASGLMEALVMTPLAHANYLWMYLANALGIMIRMEDWDRGAWLMATINQTYELNGWPAIAPRRHAYAWFRDRITEHVATPVIADEDLMSVGEVRDEVVDWLRTLAE